MEESNLNKKDDPTLIARRIRRFQGGAGTNIFRETEDGFHWGDELFADAPASIGYDGAGKFTDLTATGSITATTGKIGSATDYWNIGAGTFTAVSGSTDVYINYGKTDFTNVDTGFILGYDFSASLPKLFIGTATNYFNFDGADFALKGGTLTAGKFQTDSATDVERFIIDPTETNKRMLQIWNSSNVVRGWIGKGEDSDSDMAIHSAASLDLSFGAGLTYTRAMFFQAGGIFLDDSQASSAVIGASGARFSYIWGDTINAHTYYAGPGAGSEGATGTYNNSVTVVGGIVTGGT